MLFSDLEIILANYTLLLNPQAIEIKSTFKNQGYIFKIKPTQIIGLFSNGRTKLILLNKPICSKQNSEFKTDIVYTDQNFKNLLDIIDPSRFSLCQVGKSTFVNLNSYTLIDNYLKTDTISNTSMKKNSKLKISKSYLEDYCAKKESYTNINSLQNNQLRDILDFIVKNLNSFTS